MQRHPAQILIRLPGHALALAILLSHIGGRPSLASPSAPQNPATAGASSGPLKSLPAFSLPDPEGKVHDSRAWQGKVVVVDFWATWCVSCRETIPVLNRLRIKFGPKGLVVAGISQDKGPGDKVARFVRKMKMEYQILWDAEDTLSKTFGFEGLPSVYIFDRNGALLKAMPQYTSAQEKEMEALIESRFLDR